MFWRLRLVPVKPKCSAGGFGTPKGHLEQRLNLTTDPDLWRNQGMKTNNLSRLMKCWVLLVMSVLSLWAQTSLAVKPVIAAESKKAGSSCGSIIKIQSMAEVFRYVNRDTLLIFDVD